MRLTRRGWVVVGVVVLGVSLGWTFGPRALNAAVAPLLVALLVGLVQVWRADFPAIEDEPIRPGFTGESRTRRLEVSGGGLATVETDVGDELGHEGTDRTVTLPTAFEESLHLDRRGIHDLGPVRITQRDPLGLVVRRTVRDAGESVEVYPPVYPLYGHRHLESLFDDRRASERGAFDRLREYVPGDPLRNVDWKASAKHGEYIVTEFSPTTRGDTLTVAADSIEGGTDEMASAVASVVDRAVAEGLSVVLWLPDEQESRKRRVSTLGTVLGMMAAVESGTLPERRHRTADVSIHGRPEGATVRIGDTATSFRSLVGDRQPRRRTEAVPA